eukprot:scaffold134_cov111-Isochrysis_galbana.AAC.3
MLAILVRQVSNPHSYDFSLSDPSRQSGMVQPVVQEMLATVHAAGSSLLVAASTQHMVACVCGARAGLACTFAGLWRFVLRASLTVWSLVTHWSLVTGHSLVTFLVTGHWRFISQLETPGTREYLPWPTPEKKLDLAGRIRGSWERLDAPCTPDRCRGAGIQTWLMLTAVRYPRTSHRGGASPPTILSFALPSRSIASRMAATSSAASRCTAFKCSGSADAAAPPSAVTMRSSRSSSSSSSRISPSDLPSIRSPMCSAELDSLRISACNRWISRSCKT